MVCRKVLLFSFCDCISGATTRSTAFGKMIGYCFCAFAFAFGFTISAPPPLISPIPAILPKAQAAVGAICNHDFDRGAYGIFVTSKFCWNGIPVAWSKDNFDNPLKLECCISQECLPGADSFDSRFIYACTARTKCSNLAAHGSVDLPPASVFSTSFKVDSRCPRIQDVGCCSIQLSKYPPTSSHGAGQSYYSENIPLISFAEEQVPPTPEADSNAGFGFPLQLPSIEMQSPTGVRVASSEVQFPSENPYITFLDQFSLPDTLGISLD